MYINDTGRWTEVITNALFIKYPNLFNISYHLIFPSLLVKVGVSTKHILQFQNIFNVISCYF